MVSVASDRFGTVHGPVVRVVHPSQREQVERAPRYFWLLWVYYFDMFLQCTSRLTEYAFSLRIVKLDSDSSESVES